jgi:hypothetical protein
VSLPVVTRPAAAAEIETAAEELQNDLAEAVRAQRSLNRLVAAAVQPRDRRFAVRPEERHDRQGRLAFLSGEVRGAQSLGFAEQRTHTFGVYLQAFCQRIPVAHFDNH